MKKACIILTGSLVLLISANSYAQTATPKQDTKATAKVNKNDPSARADAFVAALNLPDTAKATRVKKVIITHMAAVRDWHNSHLYTLVPDGINPINGKTFAQLDQQFIIDSTIPKTVHEALIAGLKQDLTEEQVETILDKYTIGKVAFTMNGYKSIVPDMTPVEETYVLSELKSAREQAIDYKDIKEVSIVFKIHKTKIEDYFNSNGRNWKGMYKTYVDKALATKKGADKKDATDN